MMRYQVDVMLRLSGSLELVRSYEFKIYKSVFDKSLFQLAVSVPVTVLFFGFAVRHQVMPFRSFSDEIILTGHFRIDDMNVERLLEIKHDSAIIQSPRQGVAFFVTPDLISIVFQARLASMMQLFIQE